MNETLARAGAIFLAPAAEPTTTRPAPAPAPDLVVVLAAPRDLGAVAGGVAAGLRRRHRARAALVCAPGSVPAAGPATRAARTLATRMTARDLPAIAAGALCRVALPDAHEDATRDAWRAVTAAAGYPAVVALPVREEAHDGLMAHADLLLLAPGPDADPAYVELVLASLSALGPPAGIAQPPVGVLTRRLAALGLVTVIPDLEGAPA